MLKSEDDSDMTDEQCYSEAELEELVREYELEYTKRRFLCEWEDL